MSLTTDGVSINLQDDHLDLNWVYWDAQQRAIQAIDSGKYDIVVFRGGYGSGKSILGARQTIEKALAIPESDNLILAQDSAKGGPTTYKVFFNELPGEDTVPDRGGDPVNSPIVTEYNRNKARLTFINGATVRLGSADKWNRYAGAEFNFVWMDEVAHYDNTDLFKLNEMIISRQRTSQGPNVSLWTSTGNGYNDFYDFVVRQVDPDDQPLTARICNVVADSRNNPFLPEKDKLERQFGGTSREAEALKGGFAAAEGLVYDSFDRTTHEIPHSEALEIVDDWRMFGYDAGWDDPRVLIEIGKTSMGQLVVLDCFYESETTVEDTRKWLRGKPQGTLYCEHEPSHIEKFKRWGWDATKAEKSLDEGIPAVRERLRSDDGRPGLLVSDNCQQVTEEFLSYKETQVGKSGAMDHAMDALRYAIFTHEYDTRPSGTGVW